MESEIVQPLSKTNHWFSHAQGDPPDIHRSVAFGNTATVTVGDQVLGLAQEIIHGTMNWCRPVCDFNSKATPKGNSRRSQAPIYYMFLQKEYNEHPIFWASHTGSRARDGEWPFLLLAKKTYHVTSWTHSTGVDRIFKRFSPYSWVYTNGGITQNRPPFPVSAPTSFNVISIWSSTPLTVDIIMLL